MSGKLRTYAKPVALVVILAVTCVFGHVLGIDQMLLDGSLQQVLSEVAERNLGVAVAAYCAVTIVGCVALALPGALFAIVAAALFGPVAGTLWCVLAATVGAMLSFLAGRFFLHDAIAPYVSRNELLRRWLFSESQRNAVITLAVTRLVPLFPFNIQNFAYGATGISFFTYSICTLVFMVPGTALYAFGTSGVLDAENRVRYLCIAVALAVAVAVAGVALKRRFLGDES